MKPSAMKFVCAAAIVLAAVGYLAYAGMKEGWVAYHLPVDVFVKDGQYRSQRVRLAGTVADEGLALGRARLGARFELMGQTSKLAVAYKGLVPDLFKAGCDVVVEGRMDAAGIFQADVVMTKCASKYESAEQMHKAGKQS